MKLEKNAPSVWPGYVAAIASLVLSLLLLLAILVFALTQVGNLVSNYREAIMKAVLDAERFRTSDMDQPMLKVNTSSKRQEVTQPQAPKPSKPIASENNSHQITLIFSEGLADIPEQDKVRLESAIQKNSTGDESHWRIWATSYANDPLMERATFLLMVAARRTLVAQGISEKRIDLEILKSETTPLNYLAGEIIVNVAPASARTNAWRQP
jgi:hypothetical protein